MYPFDRIRARHLVWWLLLLFGGSAAAMAADAPVSLVMLVTPAMLFLWLAWQAKRHGLELRRLLAGPPSDRGDWRALALVPLLVAGSLALFILVTLGIFQVAPGYVRGLLSLLTKSGPMDVMRPKGPLDALGLGVYLVALAPLSEELVFRGVLLHRWARKWGRGRAIVLSSLAFCVLHANVGGAFLLALVLCAAYIRSGSLWLPIGMHALNNGAALLGNLAFRGGSRLPAQPALTIESLRAQAPRAAWVLLFVLPPALYYVGRALRLERPLPYPPPEPEQSTAELPANVTDLPAPADPPGGEPRPDAGGSAGAGDTPAVAPGP